MGRKLVRKVCFVVPQAYLFFNPAMGIPFGGAERQAYYLGTGLALRDEFEIHYCVADFGQGEMEAREDCFLWPAFSFSESRLTAFRKIVATLKKIDADVYIFRAANLAIYPLVQYLQRGLGKRCVYMVAHRSEGAFRQLARMTSWATATLMSLVYRTVDCLCVQTEEQARLFRGKSRSEPCLIRNAFQVSQECEHQKDFDFSLWVGRAESWKRPDHFLDLARSYPEEKFVMVCPEGRAPELFHRLHAEASTLPNLEFLAGVKPEALTTYYRRAKVYVLTSEAEGFANTMMESMACACPVLSLGVDPDGIIRRHRAGLIAADLESFFRYFSELIDNPDLCREMGENGRRYLLANHTGLVVIDRFAEVVR